MQISYNNFFDDVTLIASSEVEGFEVSNVQSIHLSNYWKSTGITDEWIKTTNTLTPEAVYIAGTNLTPSAVIKIQGNSSDIWTSPAVNVTLTLGENGIWYSTTTMSAQDYWRISIVDTTNSNGYITIGRIWVGELLEVEGPYINFAENITNTSATTLSISGQVYGDVGFTYKSYSFTYPWWDQTEKDAIIEFSDTVNKAQPFFIMADTIGPLYCILTNDLEFDHLKSLEIWSSKLNFLEVK
jgi:hypothetical protein